MPRRPPFLSRRPKESKPTNGVQKSHCEVFIIDERPLEKKTQKFTFDAANGIPVKEIVQEICENLQISAKNLQIFPNHVALFGISMDQFGGKLYLPYTTIIKEEFIKKKGLYFRLQFKSLECGALRKENPGAFAYYLLQCRHDFVHGQFKENLQKMPDESKKQEMLLRMLILEMLLIAKDEQMQQRDRASQLQQIFKRRHPFSIEEVLRKYIDERNKNKSEEVKKCKKIIEKSLQMFNDVKDPEMDFVREVGFLPGYSREVFRNLKKVYGHKESSVLDDITMYVHPSEGIARMRVLEGRFEKADEKTPFHNLIGLELKRTEDNPVAPNFQLIIKKRGTQPEVVFSDSEDDLRCMASFIDGYYRLLDNQYFSLLGPQETDRVAHGPIEHHVSEQLLKACHCEDGDFLIREHRKSHGEFILTVNMAKKITHYEILREKEPNSTANKYFFKGGNSFPTVDELIIYHQEPKGKMCLKRNIKPNSTGPMPFINSIKATQSMPVLTRAVSQPPQRPQGHEVQLIDSQSIIKSVELPKGRFGTVWQCLQRKEGPSHKAAVREFQRDEISQMAFEKIISYYKQMAHRMFVRLTGCSLSTDDRKFLAFEFMDGGRLDDYLNQNRDSVKYRSLLNYMTGIAEGMMYLETTLGLVHGNMNCHNILLLERGEDYIKISDACFDPVLQREGKLTTEAINASCNWRAPEVLQGDMMTHTSDVWSFGMLLWEMMALSKPFGMITRTELLPLLKQGINPSLDILPFCPEEIKEILESCWNRDPTKRIRFTEIRHRLDWYKRGGLGERQLSLPSQTKKSTDKSEEVYRKIMRNKHAVSDFLKNRPYYRWKEIEADVYEQERREKLESDRSKRELFPVNASISGSSGIESSGSGSGSTLGSGSGSGYLMQERSGSSGFSESVYGSDEPARMLNSRFSLSDAGMKSEQDIEMKTIDSEESELLHSSFESGIDGATAKGSKSHESEEINRKRVQHGISTTSFDSEEAKPLLKMSRKMSADSEASMEIDEQIADESDDIDDESTVGSENQQPISETKLISAQSRPREEKREKTETVLPLTKSNQGEENITEDMMEIANVLASMAQQHGSEKRVLASEPRHIAQKHPRMMSSQTVTNAPVTPSLSDFYVQNPVTQSTPATQQVLPSGRAFASFPQREQADSAYQSIEVINSSDSSRSHTARQESFTQSPQYVQEASSYYKSQGEVEFIMERKKRSHSITEEMTSMQKKAAKRALERPNPFNLGSSIPKNFLLPRKEPIPMRQVSQPGGMSKFFSEIPRPVIEAETPSSALNVTNVQSSANYLMQQNQIKQQTHQFEEPSYKSVSELQALEEKLSALKAASPQAVVSEDSKPKPQIAQPVSYLLPPTQQADPATIQAAINAYLTHLVSQGNSLVAGSPVLVPQIAVNSSTGQPVVNLPQLLQILQAQHKSGQIGQASSQAETAQQKQVEASLHISAPGYLQTLLAIMASKNILASAAATSQPPQIAPLTTIMQSPRLVSATATHATPVMSASFANRTPESIKKVVDIKPKPTPLAVDLTRNDQNIIMTHASKTNQVPRMFQIPENPPSVPQTILQSLVDNRAQAQTPVFVRAMSTPHATLVEAKRQQQRPLLAKREVSQQVPRTQHLILPKNLPEQLGKIEQVKEVKIAPKQPSPSPRNMRTSIESLSTFATKHDVALSRVKVEPTSPGEGRLEPTQGPYAVLPPAASQVVRPGRLDQRSLSMEKLRGFSETLSQVHNRRKSEDVVVNDGPKKLIAQLGGDLKIFSKDDVFCKRSLGEGKSGQVWQADLRYKTPDGAIKQCPVAVKKLKPEQDRPQYVLEEFKNEVKQMATLNYEYIVKLIGVAIDASGDVDNPWIITELMAQGDLKRFIVHNRNTITEGTLLNFAVQVAKGMEFLQSRRIVHRDLAARNVLVESRDRVKVCDFGLSRMFGDKDYYRTRDPNPDLLIPIRWYAPESIREGKFTAESDVWSFGVTLWEIFQLWGTAQDHATPYEGKDPTEILDFLLQGERLEKPQKCKDELWQLILGCWKLKPDERHSFYILWYEIDKLIHAN